MDDDFDVVMMDERNAPPVRRPIAMGRPVARPWPPQPARAYPAAYPSAYPSAMQRQRPMIIMQRPQPSLLAGIDFGEVLEQGVTLLAALQSLPDAPTVTGNPAKDVGNMILYQEALSDHAKSDERVRAFGGVVAQVVKALVKNAQQRGYSIGG